MIYYNREIKVPFLAETLRRGDPRAQIKAFPGISSTRTPPLFFPVYQLWVPTTTTRQENHRTSSTGSSSKDNITLRLVSRVPLFPRSFKRVGSIGTASMRWAIFGCVVWSWKSWSTGLTSLGLSRATMLCLLNIRVEPSCAMSQYTKRWHYRTSPRPAGRLLSSGILSVIFPSFLDLTMVYELPATSTIIPTTWLRRPVSGTTSRLSSARIPA